MIHTHTFFRHWPWSVPFAEQSTPSHPSPPWPPKAHHFNPKHLWIMRMATNVTQTLAPGLWALGRGRAGGLDPQMCWGHDPVALHHRGDDPRYIGIPVPIIAGVCLCQANLRRDLLGRMCLHLHEQLRLEVWMVCEQLTV